METRTALSEPAVTTYEEAELQFDVALTVPVQS